MESPSLCEISTGRKILLQCSDGIRALEFSPDGHWLASGAGNGKLLLWDIEKLLMVQGGSKVSRWGP